LPLYLVDKPVGLGQNRIALFKKNEQPVLKVLIGHLD
jgi:hypothetical protein